MTSRTVIFTVLIILTLSRAGVCLKCHNCSSRTDPTCQSAPSAPLIECPEPHYFCRKTVQTLTDEEITIVTRNCGYLKFENHPGNYCMNSNTNFKKEVTCQCFTEGCNVGVTVQAGKTVLGLVLGILLIG